MLMRITSCGNILAAFLLVWSVVFTGVSSAHAQETLPSLGRSPGSTIEDALLLQEIAVDQVKQIDAQVAKLSKEKRNDLMKKIGQMSYYASRSKGFIEGRMSVILFNYPDAFVWQSLLIFVRYSVVYPAMVSTGTGWLIPYVEPLPIELSMTMPYIWARTQINRKVVAHRVGVDPELLKTLLFQDLDVDLKITDIYRMGRGIQGDANWLLPVSHGKGASEWITVRELEEIVSAKEPEYIHQLKLLNLELVDYKNNLKLKIEEDDELYAVLAEKAKKLAIDSSTPDEKKNLMDFYLQTQDVFNRVRLDSARSVPELALLSPSSYIPWFRGLMAKTWLAFKLGSFRSFQIDTLGKYYVTRKTDPEAARYLLAGASAEANFRRRQLLANIDDLKARFAAQLEKAHSADAKGGPTCRVLFQ